jgi:DNA polymerase III subunit gamma/tau
VLVRIAYVADLPTPDEAIRMVEQNGNAAAIVSGSGAARPAPAPSASAPSSAAVRASTAPRASAEIGARAQMAAPAPTQQAEPARRIASFPELVALAGEKRDLLTKSALEADVRLVRIEDGRLEIALERHASRTLVNDLSRKLEQWSGRRWTVIVSNEAGQPTLREQNMVEKNQRERAAEADPRVKEVLARFPGAKVIEVRKLAAEPPEPDMSSVTFPDEFGDDGPTDRPDDDF